MATPSKETAGDTEHYLFKLRNTHTPTVLRSSDCKAVIKFYSAFADFLQLYKVPIKSFDQLRIVHLDDPDTTSYPNTLDPSTLVYQKCTTAIYARLEEHQVLDMSDPRFEGLLSMYSRTRDGHTLLKALLAATLMTDAKNISLLSTPPPASGFQSTPIRICVESGRVLSVPSKVPTKVYGQRASIDVPTGHATSHGVYIRLSTANS